MKYYKDDGKEHIEGTKPKEISLADALEEIGKFPTVEGNFIGFVNEKDETVQFIKDGEDSWLIDVPVMKNGEFASLQDSDLKTEKVQAIVKKFFAGEDYRSMCNLSKS